MYDVHMQCVFRIGLYQSSDRLSLVVVASVRIHGFVCVIKVYKMYVCVCVCARDAYMSDFVNPYGNGIQCKYESSFEYIRARFDSFTCAMCAYMRTAI